MQFFEKIRSKLRRILAAKNISEMTTRFDISDVVQESAIQVWQHVDRNNLTESKVDTLWLRTVAMGHYCKLLRFHLAAKRNVNAETNLLFETGAGSLNPAEEMELRERAVHLIDCVESLDPLHREVVVAKFFRELTFPQIAHELGISIYRARKVLSEAVKSLQASHSFS